MVTSGILLANELSDHIFILNNNLRADTLLNFNEHIGASHINYSPWMCAYPCAINKPSPNLLQLPTRSRGELVTDAGYLQHAADFLSVPILGMNTLQGNREDWIPRWTRNLKVEANYVKACELLASSHATLDSLFSELVDYVVPVGSEHRGYSSHTTRGAVFRGFPDHWNEYDIGIDLAHELGHHALITWQSVDSILTSDLYAPVFSSIRKIHRPAIQSFHGAVALSFMLFFVNQFRSSELCMETRIRHGKWYLGGSLETALTHALEELRENCTFTPVGEQMLGEMSSLLQ
jgi:hypothetical protein